MLDTLVGVGVPVGTISSLNDKAPPVRLTLLKTPKFPRTKALVPIGFITVKMLVVVPLMLHTNKQFNPKSIEI